MNDMGIQKGEMVALDGPNSAEYLLLWFAIEGIGAGVSYVNCHLTGNPLVHSVKVGKYCRDCSLQAHKTSNSSASVDI